MRPDHRAGIRQISGKPGRGNGTGEGERGKEWSCFYVDSGILHGISALVQEPSINGNHSNQIYPPSSVIQPKKTATITNLDEHPIAPSQHVWPILGDSLDDGESGHGGGRAFLIKAHFDVVEIRGSVGPITRQSRHAHATRA